MNTFSTRLTRISQRHAFLAFALSMFLAVAPVGAAEPPEWALHLNAFLRSQDSLEDDMALLEQSREAGASEVDIGVVMMLRSLRASDEDLFLSGWATLGGSTERLRESQFLALLGSDDDETFGVFGGLGGALTLRAEGDKPGYRAALLDLVWQYPDFADLIMSWEVAEREQERIANLRLPLDLALPTADGGEVTLGQLMEGHKALLLDFHASWCAACMAALESIDEQIPVLERGGVLLVGINTESVDDARSVKQRFSLMVPWLAEPEGHPLSRLLKIQGIPTFVLVRPDGSVAFMDHALNAELDVQIASLE